jgi:hypothetical protein
MKVFVVRYAMDVDAGSGEIVVVYRVAKNRDAVVIWAHELELDVISIEEVRCLSSEEEKRIEEIFGEEV